MFSWMSSTVRLAVRTAVRSTPTATIDRPTTVVNTNAGDRVSVDAGTKSFATDSPTMPEAKNAEGLRYNFAGR